jgi:hypothetical protein
MVRCGFVIGEAERAPLVGQLVYSEEQRANVAAQARSMRVARDAAVARSI